LVAQCRKRSSSAIGEFTLVVDAPTAQITKRELVAWPRVCDAS
jgi:hypothetical protein